MIKIDSSNTALNTSSTKSSAPLTPKRLAAPAHEHVELSQLSTQLRTHDNDSATFDVSRIAEIKAAIAEGRFSINADAIAERLITSTRELLSTQTSA